MLTKNHSMNLGVETLLNILADRNIHLLML